MIGGLIQSGWPADSISAADWTALGSVMQNDNFGVYAVRLPSGNFPV